MVEQGSGWVRDITDPSKDNRLYTVLLAGPEIVAALFRKARGGQITLAEVHSAAGEFRADWEQQYRTIEVTASLTYSAMALAEKHTLRGYDAVHLAAALELHRDQQALLLPTLTFVSADIEQLRAAQAEGLTIDNPDNHT